MQTQPCVPFDGIKVFSATMARERGEIGDLVTKWIQDNPQYRVVDKTITQSSDEKFHCYTITLFFQITSKR